MSVTQYNYSFLDKCCLGFDQALRAITGNVKHTGAAYPAEKIAEGSLAASQEKHAAALMRINHAGEVCAQALYHGQAIIAKEPTLAEEFNQAALEEGDHLRWCEKRIQELNSHTSYLNSVWYTGSFFIGVVAGMLGDKWSLGFIVETEQQVIKHLDKHLAALPEKDERSHAILQQMQTDETKHRDHAIAAGAVVLPYFIKKTMALIATVMVKTAYWI